MSDAGAPAAGAPAAAPTDGVPAATTPVADASAAAAPAEDGFLLKGKEGEASPPPTTPFDAAKFEYPEGLTFDDDQKGFLTKFATDYKVPAEGIKTLLDQYVQLGRAATDRLGEELDNEWSSTAEGWKSETKTHYKTDQALTAAIAKCESVIEEFGSPEIYEHLKTSGLANNLAVVRMLENVATALGEGRPIPKNGVTQEPPGLASLYPSMVKKD